jgi:SAM-dependent methyltransferase
VPIRWTEDPDLVAVYDTECAGRWDHDFYLTLAEESGARSVLDIGCGTGVFAVDVARRGHQVIGVEPAGPMLDIARSRPGGDAVHWIHGHLDDVPTAVADLAVLMGHVAQYFVADDDWIRALDQIHRVLTPTGRLAFETRNPAIDWAGRWTRERTTTTFDHPDGAHFTSWVAR